MLGAGKACRLHASREVGWLCVAGSAPGRGPQGRGGEGATGEGRGVPPVGGHMDGLGWGEMRMGVVDRQRKCGCT